MAKDPVLPLYYNDIDSSTRDWTDEEFGAYMRLLIYQWDKGGLPKDYQRLTRIATSLDTTWAMIQKKFQEVEGKLKNPVMEEIRDKRLRHKAKQLENINKRYQTSTNIPTKPPTKDLPLEIENENEIEKEIINEKEIIATIEFITITAQWNLTKLQINEYWNAFLIQNIKKQTDKKSDRLKHFRAWLKIQKPPIYGTHKSASSRKSSGTDQLIESLRQDLQSGT